MYSKVTKIAKAMARLDCKAEKMSNKRNITMRRMIKTYNSLINKLNLEVRKALPLSSTDADVEKMAIDCIKWAESNRKNRQGRAQVNPVCRGKRRFLAGITASYRCV